MTLIKTPTSADEWQYVVNCSEFLLHVQSAQLYGLLTGNPEDINQDVCLEYLKAGEMNGFKPEKDFIMWELFDIPPLKKRRQILPYDWELTFKSKKQ